MPLNSGYMVLLVHIVQALMSSGSMPIMGPMDWSAMRSSLVISTLQVQCHMDPWVTDVIAMLALTPEFWRKRTSVAVIQMGLATG